MSFSNHYFEVIIASIKIVDGSHVDRDSVTILHYFVLIYYSIYRYPSTFKLKNYITVHGHFLFLLYLFIIQQIGVKHFFYDFFLLLFNYN